MPLRRRVHKRGIYRTPSQTVTSSTGSGQNYVKTTTHTPGDTELEESTGSASLNFPKGTSGSAGTVVIVGTLLMITVTWNDFWKPYFNTLMNGAPLQTNIDGRLILGGILFITIAAFIASTSPDAGGVMILIMVAMWLAYITVGSGGKQLNTFFSWFQQGGVTGGSASVPPTTQSSGGGGGGKQTVK